METEQDSLFDKRRYKGQKPPSYAIMPPTSEMTVTATLHAYHAYLSSAGYSQYTPDDFTADIRRFGQFTASKALYALQTVDVRHGIEELKKPCRPKTVSRKVSALGNYFRWPTREGVLTKNPAESIRAARVTQRFFVVTEAVSTLPVSRLRSAGRMMPRWY
jgi:site-specific recombinase XerD